MRHHSILTEINKWYLNIENKNKIAADKCGKHIDLIFETFSPTFVILVFLNGVYS